MPASSKITRDQISVYTSRIVTTYFAASDDQRERGHKWYHAAHDLAAFLSGGDVSRGAGVIAALSPQKQWTINQDLAAQALGGNITGHTAVNLAKVAAIMAGSNPLEVLPAESKTWNFYLNILDPSDPDPVTIDRHACDVAIGRAKRSKTMRTPDITKARYAILAHSYREAAIQVGAETGELDHIIASHVQATAWLVQTEG